IKKLMYKYFYSLISIIVISCGQASTTPEIIIPDKTPFGITESADVALIMANKTRKFLWREKRFDQKLKDTFNTIVINDNFSKKLTEPEKAALGFVVTFVGSECDWNGRPGEDRGNLKCKALTSLGLGFQCSEQHL